MEFTETAIRVPKAMMPYMSGDTLTRNALILYPYIAGNDISHGMAAEILGISKPSLIEIYARLGIAYHDANAEDAEDDDGAYNDYVRTRLDAGLADLAAGRVIPAADVFAEIERRFALEGV